MSERGHAAILLDRDGTINVDTGYVRDAASVTLEPGAAEGLRALADAGWPLVVLSNQSGVARGLMGLAEVEAVNARIAALLGEQGVTIAGWYMCPHGPDEGCDCRKPLPGLAHAAAAELGLDLTACWMIGDKKSDIRMGEAVGASTILLLSGEGAKHRDWALANGTSVCATLLDAANHVAALCAPAVVSVR